jgi:hypothetical protein
VGNGVVDPDLGDDLGLGHVVAAEGHGLRQIGIVERFGEGRRGFVSS